MWAKYLWRARYGPGFIWRKTKSGWFACKACLKVSYSGYFSLKFPSGIPYKAISSVVSSEWSGQTHEKKSNNPENYLIVAMDIAFFRGLAEKMWLLFGWKDNLRETYAHNYERSGKPTTCNEIWWIIWWMRVLFWSKTLFLFIY